MKKLYVGNLSFKATEEELQARFTEAGIKPETITLVRDRFSGQPRGFGFVEVADDAAEKAITTLNGTEFLGRAIVVNEARPQRDGGGGGRGGRGGGYGGGGRGGHGGGGRGGGQRNW